MRSGSGGEANEGGSTVPFSAMLSIRTVLAGFVLGAASVASAQFSTVWSHTTHGGDHDTAYSAAFDAQGNAYVASAFGDYLDRDTVLTKYAPNGTALWSKTLSLTNSGESYPLKVKVRSDGVVAVCGMEDRDIGGEGPVAHLVSSAGTVLWTAYFDVNAFGSFADIAFDSEGNVYLVGNAGVGFNDEDILVARINALGSVAWTRYLGGTANGYDTGYSIAVSPAGEVVAMGEVKQSDFYVYPVVVRLSRTTGAEIGRVVLNAGTGSSVHPYEMVMDGAGNPILVASSDDRLWIAKLSPSLAMQWSHLYSHDDGADAKGVALDAFGNVRAMTYTGLVGVSSAGTFLGVYEQSEGQEILAGDAFGNAFWVADTDTGLKLRKIGPNLSTTQTHDLTGGGGRPGLERGLLPTGRHRRCGQS